MNTTHPPDPSSPDEPELPRPGMAATELARYTAEFINRCTHRIKSVGADQYDEGGSQRFEHMPLGELVDSALEEIEDEVNYAVMRHIRLRRVQQALESHL